MSKILAPDITTVAFDADDTLWHNENFFRATEDKFAELLLSDILVVGIFESS